MGFYRFVQGPFAGVFFAVEYVGAGNFLLFRAHQGQFYLILDVFNVYPATGFQATADGLHNLLGYPVNSVVYTRRASGLVAFNGKKGLGNGYADFGWGKADQIAVAFDYLQGFCGGWR